MGCDISENKIHQIKKLIKMYLSIDSVLQFSSGGFKRNNAA
jgi:hypothetical protein